MKKTIERAIENNKIEFSILNNLDQEIETQEMQKQ